MGNILASALCIMAIVAQASTGQVSTDRRGPIGTWGLTLTTDGFKDGGIIPDKYTANAGGIPPSPLLRWSHIPPGTITFALVMHDPENAINKGQDDILHWLIFNIPGSSRSLAQGVATSPQLADGSVQIKNYAKKYGYLGPGAWRPGPYHHYTFELFALDTKVALMPNATREDFVHAIDGHILGKGILIGRFHR